MSNKPLVSIVTPSLNQSSFIRATIDSILSQDYPNLEYWVIDGGSKDGTLETLHTYGDQFHWLSEPDSGQSQAINKGWQLTKGEIISWLNADDLLAPNAISHAVEAMQAHPEIGGLYGNCTYISENGAIIKAYPVQQYDYDLLVSETENFIPQPGTFLRRDIVNRAGNLDETFHYVMDYDLWLRMGLYAPMMYLPYISGYARLHNNAKTLRAMGGFADEFTLMYHKLLSHPKYPARLKERERSILHQAYVHSASFSFWGGESARARWALWRAWQYRPFPHRRTFWLLGLFAMLGRPGLQLAEILHSNPFRMRQDG